MEQYAGSVCPLNVCALWTRAAGFCARTRWGVSHVGMSPERLYPARRRSNEFWILLGKSVLLHLGDANE
jgi:hypothetical protein